MKFVIKKPLMTEKSSRQQEAGVYTFAVERKATKHQIKAEVERLYGEGIVDSIRTTVYAGKKKSRYTKTSVVEGRTVGYKKAYVKLKEGEFIDLYENLD